MNLRRLLASDEGQDLIEYGLLASLISVIAVGTIIAIGGSVSGLWTRVVDTLP